MDYHWSPRRGVPEEQQNARLPAAGSRKPSVDVALFDIEKEGDPRISWYMYYDFTVTKNEAYFQLQPGYLPTEAFPSRRISEPIIIKGERRYPCCAPRCSAEPFTRHSDLERHFRTVHDSPLDAACDYPNCTAYASRGLRAGGIKEHYLEVHNEDLIKQGDDAAKIERFLARRVPLLNLSWWRCSRCKRRVTVKVDDYQCPRCKLLCEPERVAWRSSMTFANDRGDGIGQGLSVDSYSSDIF